MRINEIAKMLAEERRKTLGLAGNVLILVTRHVRGIRLIVLLVRHGSFTSSAVTSVRQA